MTKDDNLFTHAPEDYGDLFQQHTLEIYKLYLELTEKLASRRDTANSFFLTVNTALLAITGYLQSTADSQDFKAYLLIAIAGTAVCLLWRSTIISFRNLSKARFDVIHEIEHHLPLRPYHAEWETLGHGTDPKKYRPITHITEPVPLVFIILYIALAAFAVGAASWIPTLLCHS